MMNKACVFFKLSDLIMHYPRNYKKYPDIKRIKNFVYDESIGNYGKADLYIKEGYGKYPVIVNVHGGGFVKGDKRHRRAICSEYAREGWFVYNINYRLAPQYPLPDAVIDVVTALKKLPELEKQYNLDLTKVVFTGDSAGAFYAAAAALACVNPAYTGFIGTARPPVVPTAFVGFCGAYRLDDILSQKTPLNIADGIAHALLGVDNGKPLIVDQCEKNKYTDLLKFVNGNFPQSLLVYSLYDEFCGGQTELLKEKLLAENVTVDEFCAVDKKDIHCFHLLPFHRTTASCMDKVKSFLKNIYSA